MVREIQLCLSDNNIEMGRYDSAIIYLSPVLENKLKNDESPIYTNASRIYYHQGKLDSALYYIGKVLDVGNIYGKKVAYRNRTRIDLIRGDLASAKNDFENYVCFTNSHDGKGAIKVCVTNVRVVCNNTLNLALNTAKRCWSTKHMGNMDAKLAEAQHTLKLNDEYMNAFASDADRMAHTKFDVDEIEKVLNEMFPTTADLSERQVTNNRTTKEAIYYCYNMQDIAKYLGTQYGFINAVADFADHGMPKRFTKNYAENNFERVIDGHIILDKAYAISNELVSMR